MVRELGRDLEVLVDTGIMNGAVIASKVTKIALRRLARRHQFLSQEINDADTELRTLAAVAAPRLIKLEASAPKSLHNC